MDYLTNDTELTAVADAIREKAEITDSLEWPNGFIQAIEDCETGGPELEWLWGNQITNTLSGTVDSTDDAYAGPILDLGVDGVSTQVTTTGKNLLDASTALSSKYVNNAGTVSGASGWFASDYIDVVAGSTYTLSGSTATSGAAQHAFYDSNKSFLDSMTAGTNHTFTAPENAVFARLSIKNTTLDTAQLELGSTATEYEPYTGGKAAPNPDYPQNILSVDDLSLMLEEKNLWTNLSPGYININGGVTSPSNTMLEYVTDYIPAIYGDVIRIMNFMPTKETSWIGIGTYDSNKTFIIRYGRRDRNWDWTIPEANTAYIRVSMRTYGYPSHIVVTRNETPTAIPDLLPEDTELRSLPNGTKDELHLTYLKPSDREGWAWYAGEVTRKTLVITAAELAANTHWVKSSVAKNGYYVNVQFFNGMANAGSNTLCNLLKAANSVTDYTQNYNRVWCDATYAFSVDPTISGNTLADFKAWLATTDLLLLAPLATPVTTQLDPIELPIMPSENATVWCDGGSAQPTFMLEYIQNANIVISRLEDSIADLATS